MPENKDQKVLEEEEEDSKEDTIEVDLTEVDTETEEVLEDHHITITDITIDMITTENKEITDKEPIPLSTIENSDQIKMNNPNKTIKEEVKEELEDLINLVQQVDTEAMKEILKVDMKEEKVDMIEEINKDLSLTEELEIKNLTETSVKTDKTEKEELEDHKEVIEGIVINDRFIYLSNAYVSNKIHTSQ